jgi:hypothetical protein
LGVLNLAIALKNIINDSMPIFKKKDEIGLYLLTNYKVMYSTLKHQKDLERINFSNKTKCKIVLGQRYSSHYNFYLLVRNPYDRIESFFREKFRKSLDYYENNGFWQVSQEMFFPYLGINEDMTPETIKTKLKNTSFSNIIAVLPKVYMFDGHLQPQYKKINLGIRILGFSINAPLKIKKVCKIEFAEDLTTLEQIFKIDVNTRVNATSKIKEEIKWTKQDLKIINELYAVDFKKFSYDISV